MLMVLIMMQFTWVPAQPPKPGQLTAADSPMRRIGSSTVFAKDGALFGLSRKAPPPVGLF